MNFVIYSAVFLWLNVIDFGKTHAHKDKKYDYIIVGGGTAGCVLANRLSEDPSVSVLLLEAGNDPKDNPFVPIPIAFFKVLMGPGYDWRYLSEPESTNGRPQWLGQGKMLGGSGSHNGMAHIRGSKYDYERWGKGWDFESLLPYFKKSEALRIPELNNDTVYHNTEGPMQIRFPEKVPILEEFKKAAKETGIIGVTDDLNGEHFEGFGATPLNIDGAGHRQSTLEAYLLPVWGRRNLKIITDALVTKINLKEKRGKSKKIIKTLGVTAIVNNQTVSFRVRKEVIVSAGAINSAKLLMLSGIGPEQHLVNKGVKPIKDLPVGQNLQDHVLIPLVVTVNKTTPIPIKKVHSFESLFQYVFTGKGSYAGANPVYGFYKIDSQPQEDQFPYLETILGMSNAFLVGNKYGPLVESIYNGSGIIPDLVKEQEDTDAGFHHILIPLVHLHLRTKGQVSLRSSDPQVPPVIEYDYLKNEQDIADLIVGLRTVQRLLQSDILKAAQVNTFSARDPRCAAHQFDTDQYWRCYMINNHFASIHLTSTCRMAKNRTGVVDLKLRVKGVRGLRVVDASIMPFVPSTHTQAPTIAIAEKAADLIIPKQ